MDCDLINHDGKSSDIKIQEAKGGLPPEMEGKMVSGIDSNTDDLLIYGNASTKDAESKGTQSSHWC